MAALAPVVVLLNPGTGMGPCRDEAGRGYRFHFCACAIHSSGHPREIQNGVTVTSPVCASNTHQSYGGWYSAEYFTWLPSYQSTRGMPHKYPEAVSYKVKWHFFANRPLVIIDSILQSILLEF